MAYEAFIEKTFNAKQAGLIDKCDQIIGDYMNQGLTMTLRQLYYRLVARNIIPNAERSYKNLGALITDARQAGLIDWRGIEDRGRGSHGYSANESEAYCFDGIEDFLNLDYWRRQGKYLEVWVEKEALGSVISRACEPYMVRHLSCKGYLSASEAYRAGKRFAEARDDGMECHLIHLGDHDPSGIDMTRDNGERLDLFSQGFIEVERLALNMSQIRQYNPPPNPAKTTDTRSGGYIAKFGTSSWELDALEPRILDTLIRKAIARHIDDEIWQDTKAEEQTRRDKVRRASQEAILANKFS